MSLNYVMCPECYATIREDVGPLHARWHEHIDKMLAIAAGGPE